MPLSGTAAVTPIALDRDTFMRRLIASLGHLNEGILGSDVAGAYIMNVGLSMGAAIEAEYKRFWGLDRPFTVDEYAHVIVDLKQKIQGNFSLVSQDPAKVVVRTTSCPFDAFVRQSPSLCFMTSSVFGGIAARNFGYAKTVLHKRIALGDPGCYVTVHLQRTAESEAAIGKEYFPDVQQASPDIAEQLRLMDSLQQLQRRLGVVSSRWEELVRGAADAIVVLSSEGRVTFANARWREILGVEGEELVGTKLLPLVHPDDQERVREMLGEGLSGGRVIGGTCRLRHRSDAWRDLRVSLSAVRDDVGAVVGVLGIFRDVTEEREAQRLKDEFLANASHELRTPLTTIRGLTEVLLRRLDEGPVPAGQLTRRLRTIMHAAERLALISTDLLDVAQLQAGRLRPQAARHELNSLVAGSVERARELHAPEGERRVVLQRSPEPVPVRVDQTRLDQVLANLIENACKYSAEGSDITVTVDVDATHGFVRVTDDGIGIPAADLPKLFTPFFRGSNVSARTHMGLGLGLYLCKAILESQGGDISVESVEGGGATFIVRLPLDRSGEV